MPVGLAEDVRVELAAVCAAAPGGAKSLYWPGLKAAVSLHMA